MREEFCDGLEVKFASPLEGIQQAGAPETTIKTLLLVLLGFSDYNLLP